VAASPAPGRPRSLPAREIGPREPAKEAWAVPAGSATTPSERPASMGARSDGVSLDVAGGRRGERFVADLAVLGKVPAASRDCTGSRRWRRWRRVGSCHGGAATITWPMAVVGSLRQLTSAGGERPLVGWSVELFRVRRRPGGMRAGRSLARAIPVLGVEAQAGGANAPADRRRPSRARCSELRPDKGCR